jgi:hypothetical protein
MNNNYPRYQITSTFGEVSTADWYYTESQTAMIRGDLYVGFAELTVASEATEYLHLVTGSSKNLDLVHFSIATESQLFTEEFLEAPVLTQGTTELEVYNSNRKSTNTPGFTIYTDSSYTSGGEVIYKEVAFGSKTSTSADSGNGYSRYRFKNDEDYMLAITNDDNSSATFFARFYFHEST